MSKSLQDQLRELGLAKEKQARPAKRKGKGKDRVRGKPRPNTPEKPGAADAAESGGELSLAEAFRLREEAEQAQALETKRRKQEEDRRRHELNLAIKAIVEPNRLNDPAAEESRYFMYKGRIRKVHVTPAQLEALNAGELGLVYLAGSYHLLAPAHVEAVRQISAEHVPDLAAESGEE